MTVTPLHTPHSVRPPVVVDDQRHLVDAASALLLSRLDHLQGVESRSPATYVLAYLGPLELYRPLRAESGTACLAQAGWPTYAGSTRDARERMRRHIANLAGCQTIDVNHLRVAVLPVESLPAAAYLEALVIDAMKPVWCTRWLRGFGSAATQGKHRKFQAISPWDTLHPGRRLSASRLIHDQDALRRRVRNHLSETVPSAAQSTRHLGSC